MALVGHYSQLSQRTPLGYENAVLSLLGNLRQKHTVALLGLFYAVKMLMYILAFFLNSADI